MGGMYLEETVHSHEQNEIGFGIEIFIGLSQKDLIEVSPARDWKVTKLMEVKIKEFDETLINSERS